jgi:hypothetical protein
MYQGIFMGVLHVYKDLPPRCNCTGLYALFTCTAITTVASSSHIINRKQGITRYTFNPGMWFLPVFLGSHSTHSIRYTSGKVTYHRNTSHADMYTRTLIPSVTLIAYVSCIPLCSIMKVILYRYCFCLVSGYC